MVTSIVGKRTIKLTWTKKVPVVSVRLAFRRVGSTWGADIKIVDKAFRSYWQNYPKRNDIEIRLLTVTTFMRAFLAKENGPINSFEAIVDQDIELCNDMTNDTENKPNVCLDENYHETYILDEDIDDCDTPDSPLHVTAVGQVLANGTGLIANYTCRDGFELDVSVVEKAPVCLTNGDWSTYKEIEPCLATTCGPDDYLLTAIKFVPNLIAQHDRLRAVFGTKVFINCNHLQKYVTCMADGNWSEEPADCRRTAYWIYVLIGIVCVLVLISTTMVGLWYLIGISIDSTTA